MKSFSLLIIGALSGCGQASVSGADSGVASSDAGAVVPTVFHGCTSEAFVDGRSGEREFGFGTARDSPALGYSPKCLIISAGQSATFVGNFSVHPLVPGEYRGTGGTLPTPITRRDSGADNDVVTFQNPGIYPYFCDNHAPTMEGVIWVR